MALIQLIEDGSGAPATAPKVRPGIAQDAPEAKILAIPGLSAWYEVDQAAYDDVGVQKWLTGSSAPTAKWVARDNFSDLAAMNSAGKAPIYVAPDATGHGGAQFGNGAGQNQGSNSGAMRSAPDAQILGPDGYTISFVANLQAQATNANGIIFSNQRNYTAVASGDGAGPSDAFSILYNASDHRIDVIHQGTSFRLRVAAAAVQDALINYTISYDPITQIIIMRRAGAEIGRATGVTQNITTEAGGYALNVGAAGISAIQISSCMILKAVIIRNLPSVATAESANLALIEDYLSAKFVAA